MTAPAWFTDLMAEGLARLYVLRLEASPAADTLEGVEMVWVDAVWASRSWDEELDAERLRQAFISLTRSMTRWPPPRALLDSLPPRPQRRELPPPPISDAEREENIKRLRELLKTIKKA